MKSTKNQLKNRGYLLEGAENEYSDISFDNITELLQSKMPVERTLAARLLFNSENINSVACLINALKLEKKLYPKLEICKSLISLIHQAVKPLTTILGKVGVNQHKTVPEKEFKKNNYPLPRDIASRTLARIGKIALPELIKVIENGNEKQISEAIDAVGYICFYNNNSGVYKKLIECYLKHIENDLIKWKIIRAMSGFSESNIFLQEQKKIINNERLQKEIERSHTLIHRRF